jgi:iron-sulfur cluster assembly accessory protein
MALTITKNASKQLSLMFKNSEFLRIFVSSGGCNGIQWGFEYTPKIHKFDDKLEFESNKFLYIDHKSSVFVFGSTLDYIHSLKSSEFTLNNPNAANSCGCGKSFNT